MTASSGQNLHWRAHHKVICKSIRQFLASSEYQNLPSNEQLDSLLLSHLVAEFYSGKHNRRGQDPAFCTMLSLMEGPVPLNAPPICPMNKAVVPEDDIQSLYARFANNNFTIHSHLVVYAHGIFPLASRLFNHSCVPNAAAKFIITPSRCVSMEVVSLTAIPQDEEVQYLSAASWSFQHSLHTDRYVCHTWILL